MRETRKFGTDAVLDINTETIKPHLTAVSINVFSIFGKGVAGINIGEISLMAVNFGPLAELKRKRENVIRKLASIADGSYRLRNQRPNTPVETSKTNLNLSEKPKEQPQTKLVSYEELQAFMRQDEFNDVQERIYGPEMTQSLRDVADPRNPLRILRAPKE